MPHHLLNAEEAQEILKTHARIIVRARLACEENCMSRLALKVADVAPFFRHAGRVHAWPEP